MNVSSRINNSFHMMKMLKSINFWIVEIVSYTVLCLNARILNNLYNLFNFKFYLMSKLLKTSENYSNFDISIQFPSSVSGMLTRYI